MSRLDKVIGNIIRHDYNQFNVNLPMQFALTVHGFSLVFIGFGVPRNVEYLSNPRQRGEFGLFKTQLIGFEWFQWVFGRI